jgi:branched-chain amino acid transport system substrate-binding protein
MIDIVQLISRRAVLLMGAGVMASAFAAVPASAQSDKPIRIGIPTSIQVQVGKDIRDGVMLAVEEINAKGGVLGRKLEAVVADESNTNDAAIAAIKKLTADEKVDVMIGGWSSGFALAQLPHVSAAKTVYLICGAAAPNITANVTKDYENYKYIFRPMLNSVDLARDVVDYAVNFIGKEKGVKKMAIVAESAAWTRALVPFLEKAIKEAGIEISAVEYFEIKTTDFSPIFAKIRNSGAGYMIQVVSHATSDIFIKQWADAKVPVPLGGLDAKAQEADFFARVDGKALGQTTIVPILRAAVTPKTIPFWDAFVKKFDRTPVYTAGNAYDAVHLYAEAVKRAGTTETQAIVKALEQTDYVSTSGRIVFTNTHDVRYGPGYVRWLHVQWQKDGNRVIVWPKDKATGDLINPAWMQ